MPESEIRTRKKPAIDPEVPLESLVHSTATDMLAAVAADGRLTEDLALALLKRRDLPPEAVEAVNKNSAVAKHRKVRLAIVMHPRAPRHVAVPTIRHLYTFELMEVALLPAVAADIKRVAEEMLVNRLGTITAGERLTLAKRASGHVAAALLHDPEQRIMLTALANPRMTESLIVRALRSPGNTVQLAPAVCRDPKWSLRPEIRMALLGNEHTPFARVLQFANELPVRALKEILTKSRLSSNVKSYLRTAIAQRGLGK